MNTNQGQIKSQKFPEMTSKPAADDICSFPPGGMTAEEYRTRAGAMRVKNCARAKRGLTMTLAMWAEVCARGVNSGLDDRGEVCVRGVKVSLCDRAEVCARGVKAACTIGESA
ncbi:hypothetical protein PoB_004816100 [Plakobranchus ocellatus]|uniref:Uncharacterized protein n=1 Tax=Plakobranchus ocellatus TaxID=259542 RepID=A0AAV4BE87_9GAST|nr:hypothetical protein PoB_004816100 [Plakobranchus ocellatus]